MGTKGLASLLEWLRDAPPNTAVDAAEIAKRIAESGEALDTTHGGSPEPTWREKLWTIPPETRIGRKELLQALGRPASWLYRHTSPKSECARIPHRKLDGELVFVAGEVRQWLIDHEEIVVPGRPLGECVTRSGPLGVLHKSIA
jgi:predicted DNA-binding transcriptional regulator AlpA